MKYLSALMGSTVPRVERLLDAIIVDIAVETHHGDGDLCQQVAGVVQVQSPMPHPRTVALLETGMVKIASTVSQRVAAGLSTVLLKLSDSHQLAACASPPHHHGQVRRRWVLQQNPRQRRPDRHAHHPLHLV